uniref:Glycos_transf_1 domain-containing protein n=3 Tax=Mesocestoides corti TaxID=53468 RepID=A0A5K3F6R5_MESCO
MSASSNTNLQVKSEFQASKFRIILISKSEFGCGNYTTVARIKRGISEVERSLPVDLTGLDASLLRRSLSTNSACATFLIGLNVFRSAFLSTYVSNTTKLIYICGGTDINEDVKIPQRFQRISEAISKSRSFYFSAVVTFCESMKHQFLHFWPTYPGLLRTIPQSVVVNRSDALKNADVLAAIEAELGTKLSPFVLFVGRLRPIKDPAYILQPFIEFLKKSKHRIQLLFVGSIEDHCEEVEAVQSKISSCESVHWIESIPQPQVHALMTAAVCLVNSSLSEGQPLSVMEAMALGCPVVARSIPGNLDLIDHEKTGLIFDSQNGFKDCLQRLLTDEALRVAISTRAMEKMKRPEFQLHNEAAAYLDLLRELQTRQTHW